MNHGEENQITIVDENGNEQLYEVLFTFESEEFNKSYVLFQQVGEAEEDEDGPEIHAYSFIPSEDGGEGELIPIETEEEWDMVEEMLNTFYDEQDDEE